MRVICDRLLRAKASELTPTLCQMELKGNHLYHHLDTNLISKIWFETSTCKITFTSLRHHCVESIIHSEYIHPCAAEGHRFIRVPPGWNGINCRVPFIIAYPYCTSSYLSKQSYVKEQSCKIWWGRNVSSLWFTWIILLTIVCWIE